MKERRDLIIKGLKDKFIQIFSKTTDDRGDRQQAHVPCTPIIRPLEAKNDRVRSVLKLCSSPVSSLGVVSDLVVSLVSNPVWHWSVLLDLFS